MFSRCNVADDQIAEPKKSEANYHHEVQVNEKNCQSEYSKNDVVDEERKVSSDEINVTLERALGFELSNVHIEQVDGERRSEDVEKREDEGEERNVLDNLECISKSIRNICCLVNCLL